MARLRRRPAPRLSSDRLTLGLAAAAVATAGTVIAGEIVRLARRRSSEHEAPATVLETAEQAIASTSIVTQDAVSVAIEGYQATPRHETVLFNLLSGFLGSFAVMRISTAGIRAGWWPLGNVRVGGRHIHHFVPGIVIGFTSGAAALFAESAQAEETLAIPMGIGIGMTLDEAALLLDLRDVYWTREGILSVQLSLGAAALMGGTILALRILRRGERRVEERATGPAPAAG